MGSDLDGVTDRATARILASIGAYAEGQEVPRDDLWWSVRRNVEVVVNAVATQQPPGPEDLALRRELGVRRAQQGLPLLDLMRAFRVGYLELWEVLFELARADGQEAVTALAGDAALVWNTMDQVSSAVEEGYREQQAASGQDARRRALALLTALREERLPEARALLAELGLDPASAWEVAAVGRGRGVARPALDPASGWLAVEQADHLVVLATSAPTRGRGRVLDGDHEALRGAEHVGVGRGPVDLAEVRRALDDAESALAVAVALGEPLVEHDRRWFDCLVLGAPDRVPGHVADLARALAQDPDLAATVEAVLRHDGNVSRAATDVHLHANGVTYRLRRLAEQHGVDARTSVGALEARAALTLARAGAPVPTS